MGNHDIQLALTCFVKLLYIIVYLYPPRNNARRCNLATAVDDTDFVGMKDGPQWLMVSHAGESKAFQVLVEPFKSPDTAETFLLNLGLVLLSNCLLSLDTSI